MWSDYTTKASCFHKVGFTEMDPMYTHVLGVPQGGVGVGGMGVCHTM